MQCTTKRVVNGKEVERMKFKYITLKYADLAKKRMEDRNPGAKLQAYKCEQCGYYHIGRLKHNCDAE